ncbi:MAG TPA: DUF5666 domain-containing protein [Chloroflexia bacterium]|jgi:hypothetical protein
MKRFKSLAGISAVLAGVLALGVFGSVAAAQTPATQPAQQANPHPIEVAGQVTSVSANSLVLKTRRGEITANVSANTWIVTGKDGARSQGALSDIQTGKPAMVAGMTTGDPKVIDARVVRQGPIEKAGARGRGRMKQAAQHFAIGTIKAINGSAITVTTERGQEVTVNTTADTAVLNSGLKSVSSLKVGDSVQLVGKPARPEKPAGTPPAEKPAQGTRAIDAHAIRVVSTNSAMVIGHIESINGNTITIRTPRERAGMQVTLDGSTEYRTISVADKKLVAAGQADLKAGGNVIIEGTTGINGNAMTARAVIILPEGKQKAAKP